MADSPFATATSRDGSLIQNLKTGSEVVLPSSKSLILIELNRLTVVAFWRFWWSL
jgi:hypothetical protein